MIDALSVFYTMIAVSLFVPILAGLYLCDGRSRSMRWRRSPAACSWLPPPRSSAGDGRLGCSRRRCVDSVAAALAFLLVNSREVTQAASTFHGPAFASS